MPARCSRRSRPVGVMLARSLAGQPRHAVVQQLEGLHGAVVAEEVVAAVVVPVQPRGAFQQRGDLGRVQLQRDRLQAAQLDLGVLLDHLLQRQHEQARGVGARQAAPAGNLHVANERAERQHLVVLQVEPAIGPARAARRADHQPQHAVAPAAHRPLVAFGEAGIRLRRRDRGRAAAAARRPHRRRPAGTRSRARMSAGGGTLPKCAAK